MPTIEMILFISQKINDGYKKIDIILGIVSVEKHINLNGLRLRMALLNLTLDVVLSLVAGLTIFWLSRIFLKRKFDIDEHLSSIIELPNDSRIDDLLIISGGVSVNADRIWMEKYINRAAKLIDGQKVFIPDISKQINNESANNNVGIKLDQGTFGSQTSGLININTSTLSELDKLPGIGPVYGQSIIEHRPYSTSEELVSKGAISKSVYEKIKNLISVF